MGHMSKQGLSYTSLTYVIFYLCLCGSNGDKNGFKIYRGKQDIFTNVHCNSEECTKNQCEKYKAKCHRVDNCEYCICSKGYRNTFVISERNQIHGECKRLNTIISGCSRRVYHSDKNQWYSSQVPGTEKCQLKHSFTFTRDGQIWKNSTEKIFTIDWVKPRETGTPRIKFQLSKSLKPWNDSLLKLDVYCEKSPSKKICVLLKLESFPEIQDEKNSSNETNSALVIAVTALTLLLVLALGLGCLVHYRRRKRMQGPRSNDNDLCVDKNSNETNENPDPVYETIDDDKVPPIEPGITFDTYIYPQDNVISNPSLIEHEYTYAKETDLPKFSVDTISATKDQVNNGDVHQTSGKPEQPSDDELEYNCARNTDTPRVTSERQDIRQENPANNTEYLPTVETEETPANDLYIFPGANIPTEKGYVHDKDVDIPGVTSDKAAEPNEQGYVVYHTLEQERATTDSHKHSGCYTSSEEKYTHDITTAHKDSSPQDDHLSTV